MSFFFVVYFVYSNLQCSAVIKTEKWSTAMKICLCFDQQWVMPWKLLLYLPVYNVCPCIIHTPMLDCQFERVQAENRGSNHIKLLLKKDHIFDALENKWLNLLFKVSLHAPAIHQNNELLVLLMVSYSGFHPLWPLTQEYVIIQQLVCRKSWSLWTCFFDLLIRSRLRDENVRFPI